MNDTPTSLDQQTAAIVNNTFGRTEIIHQIPQKSIEQSPENISDISEKGQKQSKSSGRNNSFVLRILFGLLGMLGRGLFSLYGMIAGEYIIDNPSSEMIVVSIDGKDYTIASGSYQKVSLPRGSRSLELRINGESVGEFEKGRFDGGSLINPTQSLYLRSNIIYQKDEKYTDIARDNGELVSTSVCLDGKQYRDYNLQLYTGLYLVNDRDYDLANTSPDTFSTDDNYVIKSEIFHRKKFISFFDPENLEECE